MPFRETFSTNLRGRLRERGTTARLVDATGIGRVQITRYLNGTLPNDKNMRLIAEYLQIQEEALFRPLGVQEPTPLSVEKSMFGQFDFAQNTLIDGNYFIYFLDQKHRSAVYRAAMIVKSEGQISKFLRVTNLSDGAVSTGNDFTGWHKGVVLNSGESIHLFGVNTRPPFQPSLLSLQKATIGQTLYNGKALTASISGPGIFSVALARHEQENSARDFLRLARVMKFEELAASGLTMMFDELS